MNQHMENISFSLSQADACLKKKKWPESQSYTIRGRQTYSAVPSTGLLPNWTQWLRLGPVKARRPELLPGHLGTVAQALGLSFTTFPRMSAGGWIGSRAAKTQTDTPTGCFAHYIMLTSTENFSVQLSGQAGLAPVHQWSSWFSNQHPYGMVLAPPAIQKIHLEENSFKL